jgi:hypothetical protein
MNCTDNHDETRGRTPPQLRKRLEAVACALRFTLPEAALQAVRMQWGQWETEFAGISVRNVPASGFDAPPK